MSPYTVWVVALLCCSASVFADVSEDIEAALECLKKNKFSSDHIFKAVRECYEKEVEGLKKVEDIIKKICSLDHPTSCIEENTKDFRDKCLVGSLNDAYKEALEVLTGGYKLACNSDGARAIDFAQNGDPECVGKAWTERRSVLTECVQRHAEVSYEIFLDLANDEKNYHEIECRAGSLMQACAKYGMKNCRKSSDMLNGFAVDLLNAHGCKSANNFCMGLRASLLLVTFTLSLLLVSLFKF